MTVGLFIPVPAPYAAGFPSLAPVDDSVPHVTLLYVGAEPPPGTEALFLAVVQKCLAWASPGLEAVLTGGFERFDNPDAMVYYTPVSFNQDLTDLRVDLALALEAAGFTVEDSHLETYNPHVTLAYNPPGTVGGYRGIIPTGSWEVPSVELWGLPGGPVALPLGSARVATVTTRFLEAAEARYKEKKKVKTQDGDTTTVYVYSEKQVAHRNREKAERVEGLRHHISDLRAQVKKDLKCKDGHKRMVALAVALMDHTCERIGNHGSADEGHYGVTGWLSKHITFKGNKATIKYVGKSGVDHDKTVDDASIVSAMKDLLKGKKDGDRLFESEDDGGVDPEDVNAYLKDFDITAKDIRGFRANDEMCQALKAERAKGKALPKDPKEREKILTKEFKAALECVAETVGHESATLKSQYLVPGLEDTYLKDGTVLKDLTGGKKASAFFDGEASLEDWVRGFYQRHPNLAGFRYKVLQVERAGAGPGAHPEARFSSRGIELYPKFWDLHDEAAKDFVFAHELGHGVLDDFGLAAFVALTQTFGVDVWDRQELPFSAINFDEAFADCFAEYYVGTGLKSRYPSWNQIVRAVVGSGRVATRTEGEKEEDAAEDLIRPAPKNKPPRRDLQNHRVDTGDKDPDADANRRDRSVSDKHQASAMRLAAVHRVALEALLSRVAMDHATKEEREQYLEDHPAADPKNHRVVGGDDEDGDPEDPGKPPKGKKKKDPGGVNLPDLPDTRDTGKGKDPTEKKRKGPDLPELPKGKDKLKKDAPAVGAPGSKDPKAPAPGPVGAGAEDEIVQKRPGLTKAQNTTRKEMLSAAAGDDEEFRSQVQTVVKGRVRDRLKDADAFIAKGDYDGAIRSLPMPSGEDGQPVPFHEEKSLHRVKELTENRGVLRKEIGVRKDRLEKAKTNLEKLQKVDPSKADPEASKKHTDSLREAEAELKEAEKASSDIPKLEEELKNTSAHLVGAVADHYAALEVMSRLADPSTNLDKIDPKKFPKQAEEIYRSLSPDQRVERQKLVERALKKLGTKDDPSDYSVEEFKDRQRLRDIYQADLEAHGLVQATQDNDKGSTGDLTRDLIRAVHRKDPGSNRLQDLSKGMEDPDFRQNAHRSMDMLGDSEFIEAMEAHAPERVKGLLEVLKEGELPNPWKGGEPKALTTAQAAHIRKTILNAVLNDADAPGDPADEPDLTPTSEPNEKPVKGKPGNKGPGFWDRLKEMFQERPSYGPYDPYESEPIKIKPVPLHPRVAAANRVADRWQVGCLIMGGRH